MECTMRLLGVAEDREPRLEQETKQSTWVSPISDRECVQITLSVGHLSSSAIIRKIALHLVSF